MSYTVWDLFEDIMAKMKAEEPKDDECSLDIFLRLLRESSYEQRTVQLAAQILLQVDSDLLSSVETMISEQENESCFILIGNSYNVKMRGQLPDNYTLSRNDRECSCQ